LNGSVLDFLLVGKLRKASQSIIMNRDEACCFQNRCYASIYLCVCWRKQWL